MKGMRGRDGSRKRRANRSRCVVIGISSMVLRILPGGRRPVAVAARLRTFALGRPAGRNRGAVDDRGVLPLFLVRQRLPFGRGIVRGRRGRLRRIWHGGRHGGGHFDRVFGPRQPGFLAARAADGTSGGPKGGRIDGVRCCTMRANDMHGARLYVSLPGCYIATVNESETITAAKPFCPVGSQTSGPRAQSSGSGPGSGSNPGFRAAAQAERSSATIQAGRSPATVHAGRSPATAHAERSSATAHVERS